MKDCISADSVALVIKGSSLNNCLNSSYTYVLANSFSIGALTACFVVACIIVLCSAFSLCVCAVFFHSLMSFEISRRSYMAIATVSTRVQVPWNNVSVDCAVRRSRSELLRAGVTIPNQSQIQAVRANPNTGRVFHACYRMISASAVVLGFGLEEHLEDTSWPFIFFPWSCAICL